MKYIIYILLFSIVLNGNAQNENIVFSNDSYSVEAEKTNGLFNGKYISKYPNGKIRAEGEFKNNMRFGVWKVYDTSGNVIQSRAYKNNLEYTRLYPRKAKTGPASLFDTTIYQLKTNERGYYDYFPLQERMVMYSKRVWRNLTPNQNKLLFSKNKFYNQLIKYLSDSTKQTYCSKEENFKTKMKFTDVAQLNSKNFQILSYKIKEDVIYDNERNLAETRIIGICPVGINKKTKDTSDLCWIYFPSIRDELASQKISDKKNTLIKSVDDLFFFRYFSGDIYKESNVYDTDLKQEGDTEKDIREKQNAIEIGMIEMEHDFWLGYLPR